MINVTSLKRTFVSGDTTVTAVKDASLSLAKGTFASIVGKSGSGKSTMLSLLGGLDKPTGGSVVIGDRDITKLGDHALIDYRCKTIGFIFQSYNLIPNLTAIENVMLPMEFAHVGKTQCQDRAASLLESVGLDVLKHKRRPGKLSGGEQQRVAIARALANKPELILADEPTGNLDSETGNMIIELLKSIARSHETTVIVVTHDQALADEADVCFRMKDGNLQKV